MLLLIGENAEDLEKIPAEEQKQFPFEILVAATKNFHHTQKLGEGGFGPVYKVKFNLYGFEFSQSKKKGYKF